MDWLVERPGSRSVVEDIDARVLALRQVRLALELNLADERRDRIDRGRHGELAHDREPSIDEMPVDALADEPRAEAGKALELFELRVREL